MRRGKERGMVVRINRANAPPRMGIRVLNWPFLQGRRSVVVAWLWSIIGERKKMEGEKGEVKFCFF